MGSHSNGQVSKPAMLLGSYPSPAQQYADAVPYHYLPNQGRSLPAQQDTWQSDQQYPASPQWYRQIDHIEAPPLEAIDPRLLQLSTREEISTGTMLTVEGQPPLLEITQESPPKPSYAQAAQLPMRTYVVCQSPYPTEILPTNPIAIAPRPMLSPQIDPGQRPPILSMHGQPAIMLRTHGQRNNTNTLHTSYVMPTHVDTPPYLAGQSNNARAPIQASVAISRRGSRTSSSTTSGRRSKREIMSSFKEHMCPECGAGFDSASDEAHHERSVHGDRRHKCDLCGKLFVFPKDVERHFRDTHDPSRPHTCPNPACRYSEEGFSRRENMIRHSRGRGCPAPKPFDPALVRWR
ncbi:hypothetical protein LTR17_024934 [Elasticomyces elasticus]|nr:hypothetical protein LTR17_024934 [Elasticomyces elasticus]